jgi:hypothetical protein
MSKIELDAVRDEAKWASKAVVACNGSGRGAVLWFVGESMRNEIEEAGLSELEDLGFDDAPRGISIWEGTYIWSRGPYEHPEDGDMAPSGSFREPTREEWEAIRANTCPWPKEK